ncbi:signal peptidase complex component [Histoplasma capsulatum G186AR]|nr:signal peptidase complex component [Histoplasma capsulatum]QSS72720.1 signal peptidase complex component [Histoplasma capsulatum G186AR]
MASSKVPVYSLSDLKNTTDDAITPYLISLPKPHRFTADNFKSNVRLTLGYVAVAIAGALFYVDRRLKWEVSTSWTMASVISYFILNIAFTIWLWLVEAGQVFEGGTDGGEKLRICSSTKKHSPLYTLRIRHTSSSGAILQDATISAPFSRWFSADGTFHPEPFKHWLSSEVKALKGVESATKS